MSEMSMEGVSIMDEKKSFVLYQSHCEIVEELPAESFKKVMLAAWSLVGACDMPDLDLLERTAFKPIRNDILNNANKWEEKRKRYAEAGRKGGLAKAKNAKEDSSDSSDAKNAKEDSSDSSLYVDVDADVDVDVDVNNNICASNDAPKEPSGPSKRDIQNHFEQLWDLYPWKRGKNQVSESTRKKLFTVTVDDMKMAVDIYKDEVAHSSFDQSYMNGSTWFNGRYQDYMGGNYVPLTQPQHQKRFDKRSDPYMGGSEADWDRSWREE